MKNISIRSFSGYVNINSLKVFSSLCLWTSSNLSSITNPHTSQTKTSYLIRAGMMKHLANKMKMPCCNYSQVSLQGNQINSNFMQHFLKFYIYLGITRRMIFYEQFNTLEVYAYFFFFLFKYSVQFYLSVHHNLKHWQLF